MGPRLLYLAVVISGGAALSLEVVWTRWMVLALGTSIRAATLVIAVFMAGLGIGALAAGRLADARPRRALAFFACAEACIGLWALVSVPLAGRWLPDLAALLARSAGVPSLPIALRCLLAALVLIPPTFLMGASLPLLARWAVTAQLLPGRSVGGLYAANTLGGMLGTLLATFVLIDRWGLSATAILAGVGDLTVGVVVFLVFRRRADATRPSTAIPQFAATAANGNATTLLVAAIAYFGSGFVGLGLEIVSHRILNVLVGSSVYAFSLMLAAFLAGIASGSLFAARWADRVRNPAAWLGLTLAGLAAGTGFAKLAFATSLWNLPGSLFSTALRTSTWSFAVDLAGWFVTLLPATFMLGVVVPLVARVTAAAPAKTGTRFGALYSLNTAGALLGAVLGGLVLVPWVGTARSLDTLCLVAGGAGVGIALLGTRSAARIRFVVATLALSMAALGIGWTSDPVATSMATRSRNGSLLALREGPVQAVAIVSEYNDLQLDFLRILADQTTLAGTHLRARRYMSLLGHLPVLWGPPPKSALVICFGTGTTAAAVATSPSIERLDIAEISPEVLGFAPFFSAYNNNILSDPRVRLHVEDGRHVALASRDRWDVITLEPPPPRDSGVVSLYSAEFYRLCRSRLNPGGLMAQWCPLESQSEEEVRMLVGTFIDAFPYAVAFLPVERDLILLGSDRPLIADSAGLRRRMAAVSVRESLSAVGFEDPADLLATAVADRDALRAFSRGAQAVTDDHPQLEYFARFGRWAPAWDPSGIVASPPPLDSLALDPDEAGRGRFVTARDALFASNRAGWIRTDRRRGEEWMNLSLEAVRLRPTDPYYLFAAALSDEHLSRLLTKAERAGNDSRIWLALGIRNAQRGRRDEAVRALRRSLEIDPNDRDTRDYLSRLLADATALPIPLNETPHPAR